MSWLFGRGSRLAVLVPLLAVLVSLSAVLLALGPVRQDGPVGFPLGTACGDATSDSVVLWTRTDRPATVVPEISAQADFGAVQALGPVEARPERDLTVKLLADGLAPGTAY